MDVIIFIVGILLSIFSLEFFDLEIFFVIYFFRAVAKAVETCILLRSIAVNEQPMYDQCLSMPVNLYLLLFSTYIFAR